MKKIILDMKRLIVLLACVFMACSAMSQEAENVLNSRYQAAILEYLQQDVATRQKTMQKRAEQMLVRLPNNEKLYDESFISIRASLVEGVKEDGTKELNFVYDISYNCRHLESYTDDYPLGAFAWDSSNSCRAICTLTKTFVEGVLDDVFKSGKQVSVTVYSTSDGTEMTGVIPYDGQYGDFRYCPVSFNGEQLRISVDRTTGICNNAQLAYIRAQSVRDFLEHNVRNLQRTTNDFRYVTRSYVDTGSHYRRSSIELTVHDAFREVIDLMTADKIQDDYVDFNIPQNTSTYENGYVLIIANEEYDHAFLPDVPFASNDGEMVKQYFVKALGVPERQVKVLRNASKEEIKREGVHWLTDLSQAVAAKGKDAAVPKADIYVYYAGHGITDFDGVAYLIPNMMNIDGIKGLQNGGKSGFLGLGNKSSSEATTYDIALKKKDMSRLAEQCISVDSLCAWLRAKDKRTPYPVNRLTVVLDAGFDGHQRSGAPMLRADMKVDAKASKRKANKNSDAMVLLAAAYNRTAYSFDTQHHGFLTYFLLKEIKSVANHLDRATYQDIYEAVQRNVNKESALQGKWQEISGFVDGKYATNWQKLRLK